MAQDGMEKGTYSRVLTSDGGETRNGLAVLWRERKLVAQLAKNDFKVKFAGSFLGVVWAFVQPVITILLYWFVFEKGFKSTASTASGLSVPFVLWLIAGLVPWFFFSDSWSGGTSALLDYQYLVKKVVFQIEILPVVKVASAVFVHLFFVAFVIAVFAVNRFYPDIYLLQLVYYSFGVAVLSTGLSYLTSALTVFFQDLKQIVSILLQVGVWMTPIMWNFVSMQGEMPGWFLNLLKLNPMFYIVHGYRDALIDKAFFWQSPGLTVYFWVFTLAVLALGLKVYGRLRPYFADVL